MQDSLAGLAQLSSQAHAPAEQNSETRACRTETSHSPGSWRGDGLMLLHSSSSPKEHATQFSPSDNEFRLAPSLIANSLLVLEDVMPSVPRALESFFPTKKAAAADDDDDDGCFVTLSRFV